MNLRLVSETATTITLGWDSVAGAVGYRFTAEKQAKPSHTWDPSRSTVKFAKGSSWYKVEALEAPQSGSYPPPVVATPLPTYRISVKPNHYSDNDGPAENYRAVWVDHSSANTSDQFPNTASVIASPMSTDPRATKKSWVWYFAHEVMIDPSWDPSKQGAWGTTAPEGHNCAHDVGSTGHGGIGWGFGAGSASFQMDFVGGNLYQHIENADYNIFPKGRNVVAAPLSKGVWHSVLTELTLGRTDGSVPSAGHPYNGKGRVRTWMDGSDVPVDTGPTDTLQRDVNPDNGITYTQTLMDMYTAGFYTRQDTESFQELILSTTAVRIGKTLQECLDDRPVFIGARVSNIYDGSGVNLGPSSYTALSGAGQRTTATFKLPPSLS